MSREIRLPSLAAALAGDAATATATATTTTPTAAAAASAGLSTLALSALVLDAPMTSTTRLLRRASSSTTSTATATARTMAKRARTHAPELQAESQTEPRVRESELVRALGETLRSLGYARAADVLEQESGVATEAAALREMWACLSRADFSGALALVPALQWVDAAAQTKAKCVLVQEHYLHLLRTSTPIAALRWLHTEVSSVCGSLPHGSKDLEALATLLACPDEASLAAQATRVLSRQWARFAGHGPVFAGSSTATATEDADEEDLPDVPSRLASLLHHDVAVPPGRLIDLVGRAMSTQLAARDALAPQLEEPLPLLIDLDEAEARRNALHVPSARAKFLVRVDGGEAWCACFSPDGSQFAVGTRGGKVVVYTPSTLGVSVAKRIDVGTGLAVSHLEWGPHGLIVTSQSPTFASRDAEVLSKVLVHVVAPAPVASASAATLPVPGARHLGRPCARWLLKQPHATLVTSGLDARVRLFSVRDGAVKMRKEFRAPERVMEMVVSSTSSGAEVGGEAEDVLVMACADETVRFVSIRDAGAVLATVRLPDKMFGHVMSLSGHYLVVGLKRRLCVWDVRRVGGGGVRARGGGGGAVMMETAPEEGVSDGESDNDNDNGEEDGGEEDENEDEDEDEALVGVFSGHRQTKFVLQPCIKGDYLACGGEDGSVFVWSVRGGAPVELRGHSATVNAVCWSPVPGSRTLVSVSDDETVRVWM